MVRGEVRKIREVRELNFWAEVGDVCVLMGGRGWFDGGAGGAGGFEVWVVVVVV